MGNYYTNITLRTTDQEGIARYLDSLDRGAYVLPLTQHCTIVCDQACESQNRLILADLTEELSLQFHCPALAVINHNDEQLWFQLYVNGELRDEYDSAPPSEPFFPEADNDEDEESFPDFTTLFFQIEEKSPASPPPSAPPEGGNAAALCTAFDCPTSPAEIEKILRGTYPHAGDRHQALAAALGLPAEYCHLGYNWMLRQDDTPPTEENPVEIADSGWLNLLLLELEKED